MKYRNLGKTNRSVSAMGYGMWGLAGWTGSDEKEVNKALDKAVEMGCNFFDTAWDYGAGKSEQMLAELIKRNRGSQLIAATKIPPMNKKWPPVKGSSIEEVFPVHHIMEYTEKSLKNLQTDAIDLLHFHVWEDEWSKRDEWKMAVLKLKQEGKVKSFGISVNRWEPSNCLQALESRLIDVVQVIYNIFDQSPEDELFPYCLENNIGVIARVPFDEGSLTGGLTKTTVWPEGDWRNIYFCKENLVPTVDRVEALKKVVHEGMTLPELNLKFILNHPAVSTIIPGMRKVQHVEENMNAVKGKLLSLEMMQHLKQYRWDRQPTVWSC
ncbi:MAG: aldo/keto reductase [Flavobacteriales bacterium]